MPWVSLQFPPTHWPGGRYSFLLAALVLMFALDPLLQHHPAGRVVLDLFSTLVLLSAILALGDRRIALLIGIVIACAEVLATAAAWLLESEGSLGGGPFATLRAVASIAFFGYMAAVVMVDVIRGSEITLDSIFGAACVYLMIGLLFAFVYLLIEQSFPESFIVEDAIREATDWSNGRELFSLLIYFSFVTLTTLGYGDITPLSGPARTACWLEAMTGQLFLATYVAGLVGIHIGRRLEARRK